MKMYLASDIHNEIAPLEIHNNDNADLLILAGDIIVASGLQPVDDPSIPAIKTKSKAYHKFFQDCCSKFKRVIYVLGNHEHYNGDFASSYKTLKDRLSYLDNLYILDKEHVVIDDILFYGATIWTDMNKEDPLTMHGIVGMMNDYRVIQNSNRQASFKSFDDAGKPTFKTRTARLSPQDTVEDHKKALQGLSDLVKAHPDKKVVVVGHHSPSKLSTHPRYSEETIVNGAYSSDLSQFIFDHPQIKIWCHGHTHDAFDYTIGETRIVCNPRGYLNYEPEASFFQLQLLEI